MKWKKSPQDLIDLFSSVLPSPPATPRKMFGYPAGFINGNLFMSLFEDDMILRLPDAPREELLKIDGARLFEPMPGRPMREYVVLPPNVLASRKQLGSWILKALEYGESLKPKVSKAKKARGNAKRQTNSKKK